MTDNQTEKIISLLENIEKHLQAIDWKFWDLHQQLQFNKEKTNLDVENTEKPIEEVIINDELESLAEIVSAPATAPEPERPVVKHTLKYPSIEVLK
jgi:hypothetical protein